MSCGVRRWMGILPRVLFMREPTQAPPTQRIVFSKCAVRFWSVVLTEKWKIRRAMREAGRKCWMAVEERSA